MSIKPTDVIAGYSLETVESVKGVFIPLTSLELTEAQADETTGDGRTVAKQLVFAVHDGLTSLPTAVTQIVLLETTNDLSENTRRYSIEFGFNVGINRNLMPLLPEPS